MKPAPRVSIIVPTLDEETQVVPCLERLRAAGGLEVLVVDGGSSDATRERAGPLADRLLESQGGLFAQLNRGALAASGDVLAFHYADVLFPEDGAKAILGALEDPDVVGGAFRLCFDSRRLAYRVIARGTAVRNRLGFGPFGDQTIFLRSRTFQEIGGFDPQAYLADFELVRQLRRRGKFRLLSQEVETSTRRWEQRGVIRTLLGHWRLSAAYLFRAGRGTPVERRDAETMRRVR